MMEDKRGSMAKKITMEKLQAGKLARRALGLTTRLIDTYGPRLSGSQACRDVAQDLAGELATYSDVVEREPFKLHPRAFLDWIRILVVIYPVSLSMLWIGLPLVSLVLVAAGILILVFEFFLYHEVVDRFFPAADGVNVHGILEPKAEVLQTVVFSGHHDSARVFNFLAKKPELYMLRIGSGLGAFLLLFLVALIQSIKTAVGGHLFQVGLSSAGWMVLDVILTLLLPCVAFLWDFASKEGTPGAGDNLIACAMGVEIAHYFHQNRSEGNPLQHTRLVVASFDGEECGLRGARAFFTKHKKEFEAVPTWNFNVDCPYYAKDLFFLTSDINGSVRLSQDMATTCVAIARSMGFEATSQPIAFLTGGTDAAEAAKTGVNAVTLMAMPWDNKERSSVYHTLDDIPSAIEPRAVEETLSIAIKFIEQLDKGLL